MNITVNIKSRNSETIEFVLSEYLKSPNNTLLLILNKSDKNYIKKLLLKTYSVDEINKMSNMILTIKHFIDKFKTCSINVNEIENIIIYDYLFFPVKYNELLYKFIKHIPNVIKHVTIYSAPIKVYTKLIYRHVYTCKQKNYTYEKCLEMFNRNFFTNVNIEFRDIKKYLDIPLLHSDLKELYFNFLTDTNIQLNVDTIDEKEIENRYAKFKDIKYEEYYLTEILNKYLETWVE